MDEHIVKPFLEQLSRWIVKKSNESAPYYPTTDMSMVVTAIDRLSSSVQSQIANLGAGLGVLPSTLSRIAAAAEQNSTGLLETEVLVVMQKANSQLAAENSALRQREGKITSLLKDLGSSCISCRKEPWSLHAGGCAWAADYLRAMGEVVAEPVPTLQMTDGQAA